MCDNRWCDGSCSEHGGTAAAWGVLAVVACVLALVYLVRHGLG